MKRLLPRPGRNKITKDPDYRKTHKTGRDSILSQRKYGTWELAERERDSLRRELG